jgi:hypothetical protein
MMKTMTCRFLKIHTAIGTVLKKHVSGMENQCGVKIRKAASKGMYRN